VRFLYLAASADRLLSNILSRVEQLSEVLSANGDNARTSTVNEEISQAFNRTTRQPNTDIEQSTELGNQSNHSNGASSSGNTSGNTVPFVPRSVAPGAQQPVNSPASSESQRRYFPALNYNKRFLNSSKTRKQLKKKKSPSGPFIRDVRPVLDVELFMCRT
jgi:hypothetical protein